MYFACQGCLSCTILQRCLTNGILGQPLNNPSVHVQVMNNMEFCIWCRALMFFDGLFMVFMTYDVLFPSSRPIQAHLPHTCCKLVSGRRGCNLFWRPSTSSDAHAGWPDSHKWKRDQKKESQIKTDNELIISFFWFAKLQMNCKQNFILDCSMIDFGSSNLSPPPKLLGGWLVVALGRYCTFASIGLDRLYPFWSTHCVICDSWEIWYAALADMASHSFAKFAQESHDLNFIEECSKRSCSFAGRPKWPNTLKLVNQLS